VISKLSGHIGDNAAALVDGQLSPELAERAWAHVVNCPGCRDVVAYEAWIKRKLNTISGQVSVLAPQPSPQLLSALHSVSEIQSETVPGHDAQSKARRGAVFVGAGAAGFLLAGVMAVSATQPMSSPAQSRPASASAWGTTSLAAGVLNVLSARPSRIGDATGLPEAGPGRAAQTIGWRLPN
jgi:anti-sigma factor RsiW